MGGKSSKQTIGYKFYAGAVLVIAKYVSKLTQMRIGDKLAWEGASSGGVINVNKDLLFGTKAEGGVVGKFTFRRGEPTQPLNSYLVSKLGSDISADRGVSSLVLEQPYMGNNPYLKDIIVRAERVFELDGGAEQWYVEKAGIQGTSSALEGQIGPESTGWSYLNVPLSDTADYSSPSFDDSSWSVGAMPFASLNDHIYTEPAGFPPDYNTYWPVNTIMWMRKEFEISSPVTTTFSILIDNYATVWINGQMILGPEAGYEGPPYLPGNFFNFDIPGSALVVGTNTICIRAKDTGLYTYCAIRLGDASESIGWDMNPAHMLRECLLNTEWGYGYDESDLDDASFVAVADQLFNEGFGLSYFWDDDSTLDTVINKILDHIDGTLYVDRATLKWTLSLVRNDYDPETLLELREGIEVISIDNYKKPQFLDLYNTITLNFYDTENGGNGSMSQSNAALFLQQGKRIAKTVDYMMCCNGYLASLLLQREMDIASNPISECNVTATSAAKQLRRGSVFKLTHSRFNYNATIMRVKEISYGDGKTKAIKISCIEDRFAMPSAAGVVVQPPVVDEPGDALPLVYRMVMEEPYFMLVNRLGQQVVDTAISNDPNAGYIGASAARNSGALAADVFVDSGAGYEDLANLDFCPFARLDAAIGRTDTTFTLKDMQEMTELGDTKLLRIDDEFMSFASVNTETGVVTTVKRGLFDTIPATHAANAGVFFFEDYFDGPAEQYVSGESVNVKLLPRTSTGQLPIANAPADNVVLAGRAARPYRPANVRYNNVAFASFIQGDLNVLWYNRNRLQETTDGTYIGYFDGNLTLEPSVTTTLQFYGQGGALLRTYTGLTGTGQAWTTEAADTALTRPVAPVQADQQFNTDPGAGYGTARVATGAASIVFDRRQGAMLLNNAIAGFNQWEITSFASTFYDMAFEADVEVMSSADGYNKAGLWLVEPSANHGGYSFSFDGSLSSPNQWRLHSHATNTSSATHIGGTPLANPTFALRQRRRLRVEWTNATGKIVCYVDGVKIFDITNTGFKELRPGFYWNNSQLRVHELRVSGNSSAALLNNRITVDLKAIRGTIQQRPITPPVINRVGYGYSYGLSYGGI